MPALAEQPQAGPVRSVRWSDLRARVISASVLVPVALLCLWLGGTIWNLLVLAAGAGMADEWRRLGARSPGSRIAFLAGGVPAILPGVAALLWLRADPVVGLVDVVFVMGLVWASDIGAYAAGRVVGGPRLAPAISPGKTWSGAAGGLACAMLVGLAAGRSGHAMLVAAGLGIASQCGDLIESAVKRHVGAKDSGSLIPGHGGLLDRLDGLLAAGPAAAALAWALGRGVELWR